MKTIQALTVAVVLTATTTAWCFEKDKTQIRIDAAATAIEATSARAKGNQDAGSDLDQARSYLKQAQESYQKGKQLFGFGGLKPEAEQEIIGLLDMADLAMVMATSRMEKARAASDLEPIEKQMAVVKAKIKIFEDRKAELEKLRADASKYQAVAKEIETLKAEKEALTAQVKQLTEERVAADKLKTQNSEQARALEEAKGRINRLTEQLEAAKAERRTAPAEPTPAPSPSAKPAQPAASAEPPAQPASTEKAPGSTP